MERFEAGVVVVGGGVAGRAAALAAARAGEDVVLLDEGVVGALPGVRVRGGRVVWMVTPGFGVEVVGVDALGVGGREVYRAGRVVWATGCVPRMVPFPGWTLRGVGALGDRVAGRRVVLAGCGRGLWREAARLGRRVVAVVDLARGEAVGGAYGEGRVERVRVVGLASLRRAPGVAGVKGPFRERRGERSASGLGGVWGDPLTQPSPKGRGRSGFVRADAVLVGYGTVAGCAVAGVPGVEVCVRPEAAAGWERLVAGLPGGVEICPCEGVTRGDVDAAVASGARDMNQLRAFTRCGMGVCQGRLCGAAASALVPGSWTVRPPLRAVGMEALVGRFSYADIPVPAAAPL